LSDAQWARIEPHGPGKKDDRGRGGTGIRLLVDAVLWLARTASPLARSSESRMERTNPIAAM